ncbi:hypothetical protein GRI97_14725 [Altererythrobacter xixiisoli]|uniref:Lipoprotein n=1 Tax=Croceibacterium xixiisoli TaxID=1476466 RepID=A0A6I4TVL8_9SPHN|nr:hypothetical protein [Croceibacterium xixiisoli]MXP00246.1 hypothetical protein [Croceibacterium xixiisoli]
MFKFRTTLLLSLPLTALLLTGCSREEEPPLDDATTAEFTDLFGRGFSEEKAGSGEAGAQAIAGGGTLGSDDGIPFKREFRITRDVQDALSANVGQNFSLRFMIPDPARFIEGGYARSSWEEEMEKRNFPPDTVAGGTTLLFAVGWELANGRKLTAGQNAAILRQMQAKLRGDPLANASEAERQVQTDLRLTVAGVWLEEARLREGSAVATRELSESVHQDLVRLSNNNMRDKIVTSAGFVDRAGS